MADRPDLAALLAHLRGGNASAMQALYELYAPQLYRYCLFRLGDAEAAQEIVQDVFVQVWHSVRTFEYRGDAALRAWLHKIASNAVITQVGASASRWSRSTHRATGRRCTAPIWHARCASA